ncbi:hypothetical protein UNDKW_0764 [Undibacterium sp. KW1]|nr:hypothetical protein UNDKW_0764 [Undibacterium sp. KW1]
MFVSIDTAVKYSVLRITNESDELRKLSVTGYVEWVLGDLRPKSLMHIATEIDAASGCVIARNPYNTEFPARRAFFDLDGSGRSVSGDRNEFIGRNGSLRNPAAMDRQRLSGKTGAGLDPCTALQQEFELNPGQEKRMVFVLGSVIAENGNVTQFIQQHRGIAAADLALSKVHAYWRNTLDTVQVTTPDQDLNLLANGWLLYQTIACRLWARSGYYQSGGLLVSVTSCRIAWRWCIPDKRWRANRYSCLQATNSSKVMYSTGGTLPLAAVCVPIALMIISGCPWPSHATSTAAVTWAYLMKNCITWKGAQ